MNEDDTRYDDIHAFIGGEMDALTEAAFIARMAADTELAADVQLERELVLMLQLHRRMELKQMLHDIPTDDLEQSDETQTEKPPINPPHAKNKGGGINPPFFKYIAAIATLVACIAILLVVFNAGGDMNYEQMYDELFAESPYTFPEERDPSDPPLPYGYEAYSAEEWGAAAQTLLADAQHPEALLMRGISYMHLEDWANARTDLSTLQDLVDPTFSIKAVWYLALLDLQEENIVECKRRLKTLEENGGFKKRDAEKLLQKLGED